MTVLIDPFEQIFYESKPLVEGLLNFYVSGSSSVRKTTYADFAETIPNPNPVVLGGDGRCPNVFGTGTYNVILTTSSGVQILARDPVGGDSGLAFGADWVSSTVYNATDQVRDNSEYWQAVIANQGNQPSLDDGTSWLKTDFTKIVNIAANTTAIAANTAAIALKYDKTGGVLTGQSSSTAGAFNLVTNTALSDAAATLTAAQLIGGEFTITPTAARIQTLDTAANIINALSGSVNNSNFEFTIVNLAAFDVTIATAAGVTLVGNMVVNGGSGNFRVRRTSSSAVSVTRLETGAGGGKVLQFVSFQTGAVATGTTTIPRDDTIPVITEGTEFLSLAMTPTRDDTILVADVVFNYASSVSNRTLMALFKEGITNAIGMTISYNATLANSEGQIVLRCKIVSGTTSEIVFKVRAGGEHSSTVTMNGQAGNRKGGGVYNSYISITEYTT